MPIIPNPAIPIKLIFEDDAVIIIGKDASIPCLPLKADETETLANGIAARWPKARLVHRLDNDTSGLIVAAKTAEASQGLKQQFDERKVLKEYTALVLGETPKEGVITTPIIHDPRNKKKMKIALEPHKNQQEALTSYRTVKKFLGGRYSLLKITIKTGTRHQIRVHLASIGHPVAGDRLYQNPRQRKRDDTGLTRQFLHASRIGFIHPTKKQWTEFTSPLPDELRNVLTRFTIV